MSNQTFLLNGVDVLGELERLKFENEKYRQVLGNVREWLKNWQLKHTNELLNLINEVLKDV